MPDTYIKGFPAVFIRFYPVEPPVCYRTKLSLLINHFRRRTVIRRRVIRNLVAAAYTMAVTSAVGRWAVYAAYLERGYEACSRLYMCSCFFLAYPNALLNCSSVITHPRSFSTSPFFTILLIFQIALDMIAEDGWDESRGALYFESKSPSTWHEDNLQFLFRHDKHFYH